MDKEELVKKLKELKELKIKSNLFGLQDEHDTEKAHIEADKLLIEYINDKDIKDAFDGIHKWYS
jgi:hypothetical protein